MSQSLYPGMPPQPPGRPPVNVPPYPIGSSPNPGIPIGNLYAQPQQTQVPPPSSLYAPRHLTPPPQGFPSGALSGMYPTRPLDNRSGSPLYGYGAQGQFIGTQPAPPGPPNSNREIPLQRSGNSPIHGQQNLSGRSLQTSSPDFTTGKSAHNYALESQSPNSLYGTSFTRPTWNTNGLPVTSHVTDPSRIIPQPPAAGPFQSPQGMPGHYISPPYPLHAPYQMNMGSQNTSLLHSNQHGNPITNSFVHSPPSYLSQSGTPPLPQSPISPDLEHEEMVSAEPMKVSKRSPQSNHAIKRGVVIIFHESNSIPPFYIQKLIKKAFDACSSYFLGQGSRSKSSHNAANPQQCNNMTSRMNHEMKTLFTSYDYEESYMWFIGSDPIVFLETPSAGSAYMISKILHQIPSNFSSGKHDGKDAVDSHLTAYVDSKTTEHLTSWKQLFGKIKAAEISAAGYDVPNNLNDVVEADIQSIVSVARSEVKTLSISLSEEFASLQHLKVEIEKNNNNSPGEYLHSNNSTRITEILSKCESPSNETLILLAYKQERKRFEDSLLKVGKEASKYSELSLNLKKATLELSSVLQDLDKQQLEKKSIKMDIDKEGMQRGEFENKMMSLAEVKDMIPKERHEIFHYKINWEFFLSRTTMVQNGLKDFVSSRVSYLLGAPDMEMIQWILSLVNKRISAQDMARELRAFMDEEADAFVEKLFRILVFETIRKELIDKGVLVKKE